MRIRFEELEIDGDGRWVSLAFWLIRVKWNLENAASTFAFS